jgi:hypothetical protein
MPQSKALSCLFVRASTLKARLGIHPTVWVYYGQVLSRSGLRRGRSRHVWKTMSECLEVVCVCVSVYMCICIYIYMCVCVIGSDEQLHYN